MLHKQVLVLCLALISVVAYGHTRLSSSFPADQATVAAAPEQVQLAFSEEVTLTALSLHDLAGAAYELGAMPTAAGREFAIPVPKLAAGSYLVAWRAVGADTHVVSGEIHFSVTTP
jgi:methionine-rich copper-binding protein CopC